MDLTPATLLSFARSTVEDPRRAARMIIDLRLPVEIGWVALALTAVVSTILFHISLALLPLASGEARPEFPPVLTLAFQGGGLVIAVILTWRIGQARGGIGTLADTVSLMAWVQAVLLLVQLAQIVAEVVLPPLAVFAGAVGVGMFFWIFSNFVTELHGFPSVGRVFAGILGTMMSLAFLLALVLSAFAPPV